jgi:hypothetical protein
MTYKIIDLLVLAVENGNFHVGIPDADKFLVWDRRISVTEMVSSCFSKSWGGENRLTTWKRAEFSSPKVFA